MTSQALSHILLGEDGVPRSRQFDDIYYDRENGLAESRYVFIEQNGLLEAFAQASAPIVIAETGFGTGLNFLSAYQAWKEAGAQADWQFISFEKYPLTREELRQAHGLFTSLQALSEALIEVYPEELAGGFHTLQLEGGKICLQLFIGDVSEVWEAWSLAQLPKASHWFLDGFAPSKNPEMWSEVLFAQMAAHAALGARFSTFTAAGFVRRGLQAAGFAVEKFKGFGRKREMLKGVLRGRA